MKQPYLGVVLPGGQEETGIEIAVGVFVLIGQRGTQPVVGLLNGIPGGAAYDAVHHQSLLLLELLDRLLGGLVKGSVDENLWQGVVEVGQNGQQILEALDFGTGVAALEDSGEDPVGLAKA